MTQEMLDMPEVFQEKRKREEDLIQENKEPKHTCNKCFKVHEKESGYKFCNLCDLVFCEGCFVDCKCRVYLCNECWKTKIHKRHCRIWMLEFLLDEAKDQCSCDDGEEACGPECDGKIHCHHCYKH
jgi:hypothetical protein